MLLNAGANVNHITKKKQNALHVASQGRYGNEGKIVKTLIQAGCKVDQLDEKGWSPLFDAAENGTCGGGGWVGGWGAAVVFRGCGDGWLLVFCGCGGVFQFGLTGIS